MIEGFVEKNKDELSPDILALIEVRSCASVHRELTCRQWILTLPVFWSFHRFRITWLQVNAGFEQLQKLAVQDTERKKDAASTKVTRATPPCSLASVSTNSSPSQAAAKPGRRGGGGALKKKTVSKTFSESLNNLMEKLRATEHHYIRCLKPNQSLKPGESPH